MSLIVALVAWLGVAVAGAQANDVDVAVVPGPTFGDDLEVLVTVDGLGPFDGGTVVIEQCANADAAGAPAALGLDGCAQLATAVVDAPTLSVPARLLATGIGAANGRCLAVDGAAPCTVVVTVAADERGQVVAVPVDQLIADGRPSGLPHTGPSALTLTVIGVGLACLYVGWWSWTAARPALRILDRGSVRLP